MATSTQNLRKNLIKGATRTKAARHKSPAFVEVIDLEASRKSSMGYAGTAANYRAAAKSFSQFPGGAVVKIDSIDSVIIEAYQAWLQAKGVKQNSVSFYMRILRSVYNRAVKQALTADQTPFSHVYTGIDKTRKRAIDEHTVRCIKNLDLSLHPERSRSRDLFLLSFYCIGMSFVDLAMLKKTDLSDDRLTYRRAKTGQSITIAVVPKIKTLIERYAAPGDSPYLLDIIQPDGVNLRRQYRSELNLINRHLKSIGRMVGLSAPLTTYVSRHTWASIAKQKQISISTISEALGHESEATTRIYLASLDTSLIDHANSIVIRDI